VLATVQFTTETNAGNNTTMTTITIPAKWQLLAADHPTVIRRLCRELNHRPNGFYCGGERCTRARVQKGKFQLYYLRDGYGWITVSPTARLDDGNGGTICASRTRCGH
jgi:hypothetical protein